MTPETLALVERAEALAKAASEGPWRFDGHPDGNIESNGGWTVCFQVCSGALDARDSGEDNGAFVAFARTAVPELCKLLREAEEATDKALADLAQHVADLGDSEDLIGCDGNEMLGTVNEAIQTFRDNRKFDASAEGAGG